MKTQRIFGTLLALGLFVTVSFLNTVRAEIPIELPQAITAEKLAEIFKEESMSVHGIAVDVETRYKYKLGSVRRVPFQVIIHIHKDDCTLLGISAICGNAEDIDLRIQLVPGKQYTHISVIQRDRWESANPLTTRYLEWYERLKAFEQLLERVGNRVVNTQSN